VGAGPFQSLRNIHCDQKFVFDDEEGAPSECGMSMRTNARLSAILPRQAALLETANVPNADQSEGAQQER
jgi:hypothetical protein